jgi:hypothetical protein
MKGVIGESANWGLEDQETRGGWDKGLGVGLEDGRLEGRIRCFGRATSTILLFGSQNGSLAKIYEVAVNMT